MVRSKLKTFKKSLSKKRTSLSKKETFTKATQKSDVNTKGSNKLILDILTTVKKYYEKLENRIHVTAYERAIYQIRKWPLKISHGNEVKHLDGIGKGMVEKIDTILKTGSLPIIKEKNLTVLNSNDVTVKVTDAKKHSIEFGNVIGFGANFIKMLKREYNIGNIDDLDKYIKGNPNVIKLTKLQELGLKYRDDLKKLVSREETFQIYNEIIKNKKVAELIAKYKLHIVLAGSYHSGKKESKDIDILIAIPNKKVMIREKVMLQLVDTINKINISSSCENDLEQRLITLLQGETKFMGLYLSDYDKDNKNMRKCIYRHVDIRLVDYEAFPYARLYFSSGVVFNKLIREKLKKRGYKLNEWCLTHLDSKKAVDFNVKFNEGDDLDKYADVIEKLIFELAELEYKTIMERY